MIVKAMKWIGGIDGFLELVDQRRLPVEFVKLECRDTKVLFDAIKTLAAARGYLLIKDRETAEGHLRTALERDANSSALRRTLAFVVGSTRDGIENAITLMEDQVSGSLQPADKDRLMLGRLYEANQREWT